MSQQRPIIFADEEDAGSKLGRKAKESPFMVIGETLKSLIILLKIIQLEILVLIEKLSIIIK
jgi:hypothetical protein